MDKAAAVNAFVGRPYDLKKFNCWIAAGEVLRTVYGVELPRFRARDARSAESRMSAMASFKGWDGWQEIGRPADGAVLLMSRGGCTPDIHAGVWIDLGLQSGCLHCDDVPGAVVFDDLIHLRNRGLTAIRYFVPA